MVFSWEQTKNCTNQLQKSDFKKAYYNNIC